MAKEWQVYIVRCNDSTLYTGCTNDLKKRELLHNIGKGALYTRNRRPVRVVYTEEFGSKGEALRREYEIKQMTREEKEELIKKNKVKIEAEFDLIKGK